MEANKNNNFDKIYYFHFTSRHLEWESGDDEILSRG